MADVRAMQEGLERKGQRGGKWPGAGRKPNYLKRLGIKAITAAEILAHFEEIDLWKGLLLYKSTLPKRTDVQLGQLPENG